MTQEQPMDWDLPEIIMVLPKPVYEALPYVYVAFGLMAIAMIESGVRFLPGALLIVAGLMVFNRRFSYRQEEAIKARRKQSRKVRQHA